MKGGVIQLESLSSWSHSPGDGEEDSEVLEVLGSACPLPASAVISR